MTALVDGGRLHNQGHYVEDQVMLLDVILLTFLIRRLNIIPSVENCVDIKKALLMHSLLILLLRTLLMHHILMACP